MTTAALRLSKRLVALCLAIAHASVEQIRVRLAPNRRERPRPLVVLTYHAVRQADLRSFDAQMRALRRWCQPVFADAPLLAAGRPRVAVTFDDAFSDLLHGALPMLAGHRIPATVFVPTGYMGERAGWQTRRGAANMPDGLVMAADDVRRLDRQLVKCGSHTVSHPRLADVPLRQLDTELTESKITLERLTGDSVTMLALPYGSHNPVVVARALANGYTTVFANVPIRLAGDVPDGLAGRIDVSPRDSLLEFRLKALGHYSWMARVMPIKRAVLRAAGVAIPS